MLHKYLYNNVYITETTLLYETETREQSRVCTGEMSLPDSEPPEELEFVGP